MNDGHIPAELDIQILFPDFSSPTAHTPARILLGRNRLESLLLNIIAHIFILGSK